MAAGIVAEAVTGGIDLAQTRPGGVGAPEGGR